MALDKHTNGDGGHKRRTRIEIERDRALIVELLIKGVPQYQIATQLQISEATVSLDIDAVYKAWANAQIFNFNAQIMEELELLKTVEREAWAAWAASKRPIMQRHKGTRREDETTTGQAGIPPAPFDTKRDLKVSEGATTTRTTPGNARFLKIVLECSTLRCKLLRLTEADNVTYVETMKVYAGFNPADV